MGLLPAFTTCCCGRALGGGGEVEFCTAARRDEGATLGFWRDDEAFAGDEEVFMGDEERFMGDDEVWAALNVLELARGSS